MRFVLRASLVGKPKCSCLRGLGDRLARVFREYPAGAAGAAVGAAEVLAT
jgi:hypothetical protein